MDESTTANIGKIGGGSGTNIVSESCVIEGEIRSLNHETAMELLETYHRIFQQEAEKIGAKLVWEEKLNIHAYETPLTSDAARHYESAVAEEGLTAAFEKTFGGSDNNVFAGIQNFVDNYCYLDKIIMWFKIVVSCLPAAVIGLAFNDWIEAHLMNYVIVALMLIIYGVLFIIIENYNKTRTLSARKIKEITWKNALYIGVFQLLSIVPGTSRSGATIIGGILLGCSRELASEYTFFLAVPVMFGASLLKLVKHGFAFTGVEVAIMIVGMLVAFVVSIFAIKFLMQYIKKHDFKAFGWYRIVLGILVILFFTFR